MFPPLSSLLPSLSPSLPLLPAVAPTSPGNLMVSEVTINSLLISWTTPEFDGFSPLEKFRANVTGTGVDEFTKEADAVDTQLNITDLTPFTFYTIQLFAINEVGLESVPAVVSNTTVSLRKFYTYVHVHVQMCMV